MGQLFSSCCRRRKRKNILHFGPCSMIVLTTEGLIHKYSRSEHIFFNEINILRLLSKDCISSYILLPVRIDIRKFLIVSEHCNSDLTHWINENMHLPIFRIKFLTLMKQFCEGFQYLYDNHIEHYDVKSENLLIVEKDDSITLKITDFGFSQYMATRYYKNNGTYGYMSPEINNIITTSYIPYSMDVYSTSCMLIYILYPSIQQRFITHRAWDKTKYILFSKYVFEIMGSSILYNGIMINPSKRISMKDFLQELITEINQQLVSPSI